MRTMKEEEGNENPFTHIQKALFLETSRFSVIVHNDRYMEHVSPIWFVMIKIVYLNPHIHE